MIETLPSKARYIMIGGFLGAGKTTAVARLAAHLTERGVRVGLISNDQSQGLVDTANLKAQGFNVAEIAGGCFCCRFNSLVDAADRLTAETKPDVIVAEPVGSCTDLIATVSYPLRRIYGDRFTIAPLSVLVDPTRAARILGLSDGRSFSEKVIYVYRKQLEEAEIIVVNKCDTIDGALRDRLVTRLKELFPRAEVLSGSAREGTGLSDWFECISTTEGGSAATMELDYERYAEGEALLGWLNATVQLSSEIPFDGNALLVDLTESIRSSLASHDCEIAHLKMTLDAADAVGNLSVVSVVGTDGAVDLRESLLDRVRGGELIINLRVEADPALLRRVTVETLDDWAKNHPGVTSHVEHMEHFRPAKPTPTHRIHVSA